MEQAKGGICAASPVSMIRRSGSKYNPGLQPTIYILAFVIVPYLYVGKLWQAMVAIDEQGSELFHSRLIFKLAIMEKTKEVELAKNIG